MVAFHLQLHWTYIHVMSWALVVWKSSGYVNLLLCYGLHTKTKFKKGVKKKFENYFCGTMNNNPTYSVVGRTLYVDFRLRVNTILVLTCLMVFCCRLLQYFKGNHHLEEIMLLENLPRSKLLTLIDKFSDILVTCLLPELCWLTCLCAITCKFTFLMKCF